MGNLLNLLIILCLAKFVEYALSKISFSNSEGSNFMCNRIIRRAAVFSIWCVVISIGNNFIAIGSLCILIGLIVITTNIWMRSDYLDY